MDEMLTYRRTFMGEVEGVGALSFANATEDREDCAASYIRSGTSSPRSVSDCSNAAWVRAQRLRRAARRLASPSLKMWCAA